MSVTGFQLKEKPIVLLEKEIYPALKKFDQSEKFGLCEDIKKSMLYIIRQAGYYCYDKRGRQERLDRIDMELNVVKMQFDISLMRGQITDRRKTVICNGLSEIGRIVGGLKKCQEPKEDEVFREAVQNVINPDFLKALVNFPKSERGCLTRAIFNGLYDIARYYKGYTTSRKYTYLEKIDAAVCTLMDYINIAKEERYISRKKALNQEQALNNVGIRCGEMKKKHLG